MAVTECLVTNFDIEVGQTQNNKKKDYPKFEEALPILLNNLCHALFDGNFARTFANAEEFCIDGQWVKIVLDIGAISNIVVFGLKFKICFEK